MQHLLIQDFLESEGIVVNEPEAEPKDFYLTERAKAEELALNKTPSSFDKKRQFLELDKKVLCFYAVHDNRNELYGDLRKFIIHVNYNLNVNNLHNY